MLARVAIAVMASAALALGLAGTATAAPAATALVPAKKLDSPNLPSCVTLDWKESGFAWHNQAVMATNSCGSTVGVRIYNYGHGMSENSGCIAIAPGETSGWKWTKGRKYQYTESCTP